MWGDWVKRNWDENYLKNKHSDPDVSECCSEWYYICPEDQKERYRCNKIDPETRKTCFRRKDF